MTQSIILIDLFYMAGIKLVSSYDRGQAGSAVLIIVLTVLVEALAIGVNVGGYVVFGDETCGSSLWVNVTGSVVLALLPLLQFLNFNRQNSLLTTALVGLYVSFLSFISQYSFGDPLCTRMTDASLAADILVSTLFFILTMYGSIMGGSGKVKITENTDLHAVLGVVKTEEGQGQQEAGPESPSVRQELQPRAEDKEEVNLARYRGWGWVKWHFYMCLASMYVGMLITNWTSASLTTGSLSSSQFGFWVRVLVSWLTAFLYAWTLVAPRLCPARDFEVV